MPPRRARQRLTDILEAIAKVELYVRGMDATAFVNDPRTIDAVIHNIQIIGEAVSALEPGITNRYPEIPWINIVSMRHLLVHGYFGVDFDIVWDTASRDMAPLRAVVQRMLAELPAGE